MLFIAYFYLVSLQSGITISYDWLSLSYLTFLSFNGQIPWGTFLITYNATKVLASYLLKTIDIYSSFYDVNLYLDNYNDFCRNANTEKSNEDELGTIKTITIQNVSFGYKNAERIINNINFSFKKNHIYAILGDNGAGKTTLLKLIGGILSPTNGTIRINECDLNTLDKKSLYKHISLVKQDFHFFAMSIGSNVLLKNRLTIDEKEYVESILKELGLWDRIGNLPEKLDTIMSNEFSKNGTLFSGGELQRLALARAYAQNTDVILLDEPFSAIDINSYYILENVLKHNSAGKIIIYITHDLRTVQIADTVLSIFNKKLDIYEK